MLCVHGDRRHGRLCIQPLLQGTDDQDIQFRHAGIPDDPRCAFAGPPLYDHAELRVFGILYLTDLVLHHVCHSSLYLHDEQFL